MNKQCGTSTAPGTFHVHEAVLRALAPQQTPCSQLLELCYIHPTIYTFFVRTSQDGFFLPF